MDCQKTRTVRLIALALFMCFPCIPQDGFRPVTGIVTDKRGNTLPGAVVQAENAQTLWIVSYITCKDGRYRFSRLRRDVDYIFRAKYRKYWSEPKTLSKFNESEHPEVDLMILID
jgi:hypothetical protein